MSSELPKLSRSIRGHTDLDIPRNLKNNEDARSAILMWQSKECKHGITWSDFIKFIKNEGNNEVLQLLLAYRKDIRAVIGKVTS